MKGLSKFKRLFKYLKNPIILGIVILIAVCLAVWLFGPAISISGNAILASPVSRLVVIIICLGIWGGINLILYAHHLKKSMATATATKAEDAKETEVTPEPEVDYEAEQLEQSFRTVSKFSRKILPWHLVIGSSFAGKTSLLDKATTKFKFPEGKGIKDLDVTDVCSWHLTKEKVFLELGDSAVNTKSPVWKNILQLLKAYRRRNPLRGLTIVCSVAELLQQTNEQRKVYAATLRQHIYEMHRQLGIRIPITIIFSKADLIAGFSEFFENLSEEEKQQVWGIKFSETGDFSKQFIEGFDDLIARLNERLISRMHNERDDKRAAIIASFALQMAALKPILHDFVQGIVVSAKFIEPVQLNGTYFTSSLQAGTPIDVLLDSVSDTFNLDKNVPVKQRVHSNIAYFVNHVFDVRSMRKGVQLTQQMQRRQKLIMWWGSGIGAAILIIATIAWYVSYSDASKKVAELQQTLNSPQNVEQFSKIDTDFAVWWQKHAYLNLGYPKHKLGKAVRDAYVSKLQQEFMPEILGTIEQTLKMSLESKQAVYSNLKIYLMLAYPQHMDLNAVKGWMQRYWQEALMADPRAQDRLNKQLDIALSQPLAPMKIDMGLVAQARSVLRSFAIAQVAYMNLAQQIKDQNVGEINLFGSMPDQFAQVFTDVDGSPKISKLYTPDGYTQLYKDQHLQVLKDTLEGDWVLGTPPGKVPPITDDMKQQMLNAYYQDYISQWEKALGRIRVLKRDNLSDLLQLLGQFSSGVSPLVQIVQDINTNTTLSSSFLKDKAKALGNKISKKHKTFAEKLENMLPNNATPVDNAFASLHDLQVANLQKVLSAVYTYMQAMNSPDTAFKAAQDLMSGDMKNPILQLLQQANSAPQPINRWMQNIARQCIGMIFQEARQYIQAAWDVNVYPAYVQAIKDRYPLVKTATDEVNLIDFAGFFGPQGVAGKFYTQYFAAFVQPSGNNLVWNTVAGVPIGFSDATLKMLQRLVFIQNAYFAGGSKSVAVTFIMKPLALSGHAASIDVTIGGNDYTYKHGPLFPQNVTWPGKGGNDVTVSFTSINGQVGSVTKQGDWGLFRLLDECDLKSAGVANSTILKIGSGDYEASYMLRSNSDANPFDLDMLHGFRITQML